MADLPPDRLDPAPPFTNVGLNIFGDLNGKATRSHIAENIIWVVLFTCLSSSAVYLELIDSLDISTFKNALSCFLDIICLEVTKSRTLWDPETKTKHLAKRSQST